MRGDMKMKIDFSILEKMDQKQGEGFLIDNGYDQLATQRDPLTEEWIHPFVLYDDPENDDPAIIHLVYYSYYRKPGTNEPDKEEQWHWWEDSRYNGADNYPSPV
jgi:hypothetical protein